MKKLLPLVLLLNLTGCAYYDGQRVMADPDCRFVGKPDDYVLPKKCGPKSYGGTWVSVTQVTKNSYIVKTDK